MITIDELRARIDSVFERTLDDLKLLVSIPSISQSGYDHEPLEKSANTVARLFAEEGLDTRVTRSVLPDGRVGHPAVIATRDAEASVNVLLYSHHDVQPVSDPEEWDQADPFVAVVRSDRLYGRGTTDDKAGIAAHLGAIRALGTDLKAGVRILVEGEEEIGSPSFAQFLSAHHDELVADLVLVLDSVNWKVGVPALTASLRGLVEARVTVRHLEHALHSGMYGGPILDAPTLLSRLIATLHDDCGNVAIDGLVGYDRSDLEYAEDDFRKDAGVLESSLLAGDGSLASLLWTKPAISVIGMDVVSVEGRSNTITPSASAALSLRIAPGQDPQEAFDALKAHLMKNAPFGARVEVIQGELGDAFTSDLDSPSTRLAQWALETAWKTPPVFTGVGGSIPFISDLSREFPNAEVLITGVEDPDSRAHAPNESQNLTELKRAMFAEALILAKLSGVLIED